jgi:hypothetical protein
MLRPNRTRSFAVVATLAVAVGSIPARAQGGSSPTAADSIGVPEVLPDLEEEQRRHDERRMQRELELIQKGQSESTQRVPATSLRGALIEHGADPGGAIPRTVVAE